MTVKPEKTEPKVDIAPATNETANNLNDKSNLAAALPGDQAMHQAADTAVHLAETVKTLNDEFNLKNLVLNQDFVESAGVKKLLTTVPVRKPSKQDFIRVHPSPDFRATVALLELRDDREIYLLTPAIALELPGEFYMATLYTAINRQNVPFLWPVKLPAPDGRQLDWHRSAAEAAELAMRKWIRVQPNMNLGAYEISDAGVTHSEPQWPPYTFQDYIPIAFKGRLISRLDHPVVQRLRGLT